MGLFQRMWDCLRRGRRKREFERRLGRGMLLVLLDQHEDADCPALLETRPELMDEELIEALAELCDQRHQLSDGNHPPHWKGAPLISPRVFRACELLQPCPPEWLEAFPVNRAMNKVGYDAPDCVERVEL